MSKLKNLATIVSAGILSLGMSCAKPRFQAAVSEVEHSAIYKTQSKPLDYSGISIISKAPKLETLASKYEKEGVPLWQLAANVVSSRVIDVAVHESGHAVVHNLSPAGRCSEEANFLPAYVDGIHPMVPVYNPPTPSITNEIVYYDVDGNVVDSSQTFVRVRQTIIHDGRIAVTFYGTPEEVDEQRNEMYGAREAHRQAQWPDPLLSYLSGPMATLALAESTSYMLRAGHVSEDTQAFWSTMALMSRGHVLFSTFQKKGGSGGDHQSDISHVSEISGIPQGYFAALGLAYIAANHERIAKEFRVAQGLDKFETSKPYTFAFIPTSNSLALSMSISY